MTETFRVIFQTVPPRPSWTAWRHKTLGTLTVASDHARFVPRKGEPILISNVFRVSMGGGESVCGEPLDERIDTYIEVLYGERAAPSVAYINDGRLLGLAMIYLSHRRLLKALSALVAN